MMNSKIIPFLICIVLVTISCSKTKYFGSSRYSGTQIIPTDTVDCSGYTSQMTVLYGLTLIPGMTEYSGTKFADILAVDHTDGTMSVAILPPSDSGFRNDIFSELEHDYTLKFVACNELPSSAFQGNNAELVCNPFGARNILGGIDKLTSDNFTDEGFKVLSDSGWTRVHATKHPVYDEGKSLPTFIMLVAKPKTTYGTSNEIIIAAGDSPYKMCYFKK